MSKTMLRLVRDYWWVSMVFVAALLLVAGLRPNGASRPDRRDFPPR